METEFLVADALAAAADHIVKALSDEGSGILLVEGPQSQGNVRLLSFEAEVYGLKKSAQRALGEPQELCTPILPPRATNNATVQVLSLPFATGAFIGALGDMLKTDTTITGKSSSLTEAQLIRALLVRAPAGKFRTTYFDSESLNPDNSVIQKVDFVSRYQQKIDEELASFDTDEKKKANAAKIARLNFAATGIDGLFERLLKVDKDSPPLLGLLYADSEIGSKSGKVLRIWVDANGGTFINRRNLWTSFGARALSMTGGAIVSYTLIDRPSTNVVAAGFLKCTTDLVSLRKAQQRNLIVGDCTPLALPPEARQAVTNHQ